MKLNSIKQKTHKEYTYKKKQNNNEKKIKTYYECDKSNHFTKNCYSKMQQQFNIIIKCDKSENYNQIEKFNEETL